MAGTDTGAQGSLLLMCPVLAEVLALRPILRRPVPEAPFPWEKCCPGAGLPLRVLPSMNTDSDQLEGAGGGCVSSLLPTEHVHTPISPGDSDPRKIPCIPANRTVFETIENSGAVGTAGSQAGLVAVLLGRALSPRSPRADRFLLGRPGLRVTPTCRITGPSDVCHTCLTPIPTEGCTPGDTYSFFLTRGPFSLVSRPPKKPLTFSVLADVFFSSRSAMSFFSANQLLADFR